MNDNQNEDEPSDNPHITTTKNKSAHKKVIPPGLYIVSTPIGNAQDLSLRALQILSFANHIVCEDTRVTKKLFKIHNISNQLTAYNDHNAEKLRPSLIKRLQNQESIGLVSDAGTPLISDPGYKLVSACIEKNIPITTVPGASSVLSSLIISGLPTDKFFFYGFLPNKTRQRKSALRNLESIPGTLIFFESTKRLQGSLADMLQILGDRRLSIARELTKLFEEVRRGSLSESIEWYQNSATPKGEVTIIVGPKPDKPELSDNILDNKITHLLPKNSTKETVNILASKTNLSKRHIYSRILMVKSKLKL